MSFGDILKDSFAAALRHPLDGSATLREFRRRQAHRKFANQVALDAMRLQGELRRIVADRAKYTQEYGVKTVMGTFEGYPAQIEYGQTNNPRRVDIYYGDLRELRKKGNAGQDKAKYGHIIVIGGVVLSASRYIRS